MGNTAENTTRRKPTLLYARGNDLSMIWAVVTAGCERFSFPQSRKPRFDEETASRTLISYQSQIHRCHTDKPVVIWALSSRATTSVDAQENTCAPHFIPAVRAIPRTRVPIELRSQRCCETLRAARAGDHERSLCSGNSPVSFAGSHFRPTISERNLAPSLLMTRGYG